MEDEKIILYKKYYKELFNLIEEAFRLNKKLLCYLKQAYIEMIIWCLLFFVLGILIGINLK